MGKKYDKGMPVNVSLYFLFNYSVSSSFLYFHFENLICYIFLFPIGYELFEPSGLFVRYG